MTDKYKNLLKEVGLEEDAELERMIQEISNDPSMYGQIEPPAGYETHLLNALRTKIPLESKPSEKNLTSSQNSWVANLIAGLFASRALAWSVSGAMAVFVAFMSFQTIKQLDNPSASDDFLVQTAQKGDSQVVARWIASVADMGVQMQTDGTEALAEDLAQHPELAKQAFDDVAKSLGYVGDL